MWGIKHCGWLWGEHETFETFKEGRKRATWACFNYLGFHTCKVEIAYFNVGWRKFMSEKWISWRSYNYSSYTFSDDVVGSASEMCGSWVTRVESSKGLVCMWSWKRGMGKLYIYLWPINYKKDKIRESP